MKTVAIIGSHGLYANYGGWDPLVNNLAELKSENIEYLIFNSSESQKNIIAPPGVTVKRLRLKASGFQGLFYDFLSILMCYWKVDTLLLLGVQGIPLVAFLSFFKKIKVVSNAGGIEWERPKFGFFSKQYLKLCFYLSFYYSDSVVFDNEYYNKFLPKRMKSSVIVLPYGGVIDFGLSITQEIMHKYSFIQKEYFLSISRSLEDNLLEELCESFVNSRHTLVLISNFTKSLYGNRVLNKYSGIQNIILINGLYIKPELDLIRRKCKAYIHTHTLCGTAPSLVEMIISRRPIISIDVPQNRYTLHNQAFFFKSFLEVQKLIEDKNDLSEYITSSDICTVYNWGRIVLEYESMF